MITRNGLVALGLVLLAAFTLMVWTQGGSATDPRLLDRLPADPMLAGVFVVEDPAERFDYWMEFFGRLSSEGQAELESEIARLDEKLGLSVRDDVLRQIGPNFAMSVDVPALDSWLGGAAGGTEDAAGPLDDLLLIVQVRDAGRVDRAVRALATLAGSEVTDAGEPMLKIALERPPASLLGIRAGSGSALYYRIAEGYLTLGFSRDRVVEAVEGFPRGSRLADGSDFGYVFGHLEPDPDSLTYFNLPKLRRWLEDSSLVTAMAAGDAQSTRLLEAFLTDEWMGVGMGTTSMEVDGRMRTSQFGPRILSGFTLYRELSLSMVLPAWLGMLHGQAQVPPATPTVGDPPVPQDDAGR